MASIRSIVPRAGFQLHSRQLLQLRKTPLMAQSLRHASSERPAPPKPRVLEKPDKFRPPSHPARLASKTRYTYGPDLTPTQKTKRYPHMMPPEGTFFHWFLTNRTIHLWISLSILISLVLDIWITEFLNNTPYKDMLPPRSMFFSHPFAYVGRWWEVYDLHVAYVSAQTAERRKQKVDDVKKRSDYRKAHGLDDNQGLFGGWTAKSDEDVKGPALREGDIQFSAQPGPETAMEFGQSTKDSIGRQAGEGEETYVDFDGKTQPQKKKWFGIW